MWIGMAWFAVPISIGIPLLYNECADLKNQVNFENKSEWGKKKNGLKF
jgi:hypothetical protein